jgi:hypothetical protein
VWERERGGIGEYNTCFILEPVNTYIRCVQPMLHVAKSVLVRVCQPFGETSAKSIACRGCCRDTLANCLQIGNLSIEELEEV